MYTFSNVPIPFKPEYIDEVNQDVWIWHIERIAKVIPGVYVSTGILCQKTAPQSPESSNLYVFQCQGKLLNHAGPHSWEAG